MPMPILQQTAAAPVISRGCRVFVSYSHEDMNHARQFIKFFRLKLAATTQLGIAREDVFFDRDRLLAGQDWDESIHHALEQAQYFIFLVSANSLSSEYCVRRELKFAAERALPILQIVLHRCPWEGQELPGDPQQRTLGAFGALPKDADFKLRPITEWSLPDGSDAWNNVVEQLAISMLNHQAQPTPVRTAQPSTLTKAALHRTPLLPFFCNQAPQVSRFNNGVMAWDRRALIVLTRGLHEDNVPRFWDRLLNRNLKDYLIDRNAQLLEPQPFIWPFEHDQKLNASEAQADMRRALSQALTGSTFRLQTTAALCQHLGTLQGVQPLMTTLPRGPKKTIAAGLRSLLDLLEQCLAEAPLERLVIGIVIEDATLLGEKDLCKTLKLTGHQRSHIIDLMPLQQIDDDDIRPWHRAHDIETMCRLSEPELLRRLFGESMRGQLRMGQFSEKVKPLLGL